MEIVKMNKIYFSPTGGTKKVVDIVSKTWDLPTQEIDISLDIDEYKFSSDELCIIAVPSFGGRVPSIALERLSKLKANHTPAIFIVTFGNRAIDDTLLELLDETQKYGFVTVGAIEAVCQHSIMAVYGTGRPDEKDKKELEEYANTLKRYIKTHDTFSKIYVPGNKPYKEYKGLPLKPITNDQCKQCGMCAKLCPVHAISIEHPQITNNEKCISCMRCIHICPRHARICDPKQVNESVERLKKVCEAPKKNQLYMEEYHD